MTGNIRKIYYNYASAIVEYALIIGVISAALMALNIYIKRGVQAKVKDLTDTFIGPQEPEQTPEELAADKTATTSNTTGYSRVNKKRSKGGKASVKERARTKTTFLQGIGISVLGGKESIKPPAPGSPGPKPPKPPEPSSFGFDEPVKPPTGLAQPAKPLEVPAFGSSQDGTSIEEPAMTEPALMP